MTPYAEGKFTISIFADTEIAHGTYTTFYKET